MKRAIACVSLLILRGAASAADPGAAAPPWSIGSPAAAGSGARFGLGLQHEIEELESLDWESSTTGVQVPLALSCFRLKDSLCLFPTLTLEAASTDVTLPSGQGSGDLFGAGLDVTFALCESCSGFVGGSYRFRTIPGLDLHGLGEARLSRDTHMASARLGYVLPGNRFAPYLGLRGQWRDVEIEFERRRTKLDSNVTEGLLGVDARLWGPLFARLEMMVGGPERDCGVQVNLAYVGPRTTRPERAESFETPERTEERAESFEIPEKTEERAESFETPEKTEERAREVAAAIAPRLEKVLADFLEGRRNLPIETAATGVQAYPRGAVYSLLTDTERNLLSALTGPDLTAMRDYVQDLFLQARIGLGLQPAPVRVASLRPVLMQRADPLEKETADSWLDKIGIAIQKIIDYSNNNDLVLTLCVKSYPKNRASLSMHPVSYDESVKKVRTNGRLVNVWRGLYSYTVSRRGFKEIKDELDLVDGAGPVLDCELTPDSAPDSAMICQLQSGNIERECPE